MTDDILKNTTDNITCAYCDNEEKWIDGELSRPWARTKGGDYCENCFFTT